MTKKKTEHTKKCSAKTLAGKNLDKAWDIRLEGKLNKNNFIFQDEAYKKLYLEMKKVNDELKKTK